MRHLWFWIVFVPLVIVLADFTVMNMQEIAVDLRPLPWDVSVPLYAVVFGSLLIGALLGVLVMWRHGSSGRRRHRDLNRQFNVQTGELETLRRQTATTARPSTALAKADPNAADPNALVPPAI